MNTTEEIRHYSQLGHGKCADDAHRPEKIGERDRGYVAGVAIHPYTDENRAAHGGITYTEECSVCGSRRQVNQNGPHFEYGPWGETAGDRQRKIDRERNARIAAEDLAASRMEVLEVTDSAALVRVGHDLPQWVYLADVESACHQPDTELAIAYRGLRRKIDHFRSAKKASALSFRFR